MNKLNYSLKYVEYLFRKCRGMMTSDLYFHTAKLNKTSQTFANLKKPITLSEKICHRLVFDHNALILCWPTNWRSENMSAHERSLCR